MRYFGPGEYPYKTIAKYKPMESAATALTEFGYGAHALHNNGGNFYSRAEVFEQMGFDTYTSKELKLISNIFFSSEKIEERRQCSLPCPLALFFLPILFFQ